ncbi:MAG: GNAT family N-acetyltransferase [Lachnospiraceae bacterium]
MNSETCVLVMPSMKHRKAAMDYVAEFVEIGDDIDGMGEVSQISKDYDSYGRWLYWLYGEKNSGMKADTAEKEGSSFTYFFMDETEEILIGTVNIREGNSVSREYGNIGYAIRPSLRNKGYGTQMLESAISLCGFMGIEHITAVCLGTNTAGVRILLKCGFRPVAEKRNSECDRRFTSDEIQSFKETINYFGVKYEIRFERNLSND